jgi:hypothetical protein
MFIYETVPSLDQKARIKIDKLASQLEEQLSCWQLTNQLERSRPLSYLASNQAISLRGVDRFLILLATKQLA